MSHSELRELAYRGRSAELHEYAAKILAVDPTRTVESDALTLASHFASGDFPTTLAYVKATQFKYQKTQESRYITRMCAFVTALIDFASGRFTSCVENSEIALSNSDDFRLENNDLIMIYRLMAMRAYIADDYAEVKRLHDIALNIPLEGDPTHAHYHLSSIEAMYLQSTGDFIAANKVARENIILGTREKFVGLAGPIDSYIVSARSLQNMAKISESNDVFMEACTYALKGKVHSFYLYADGYLARDLANQGKMADALTKIREQKDYIAKLDHAEELTILPDLNELYIRYVLNDVERMDVLMSRLPNFLLVDHIKHSLETRSEKFSKADVDALPSETWMEKMYKEMGYVYLYMDRESEAKKYLVKVLDLAEKTGAIEYVLRSDPKVLAMIIRLASEKPSVFLEELARMVSERMTNNENKKQGDLVSPLTPRELEIVRHLASGKPITSIAAALHISQNTMKTHLRNTYRKLDAQDRKEAVEKAKAYFLI